MKVWGLSLLGAILCSLISGTVCFILLLLRMYIAQDTVYDMENLGFVLLCFIIGALTGGIIALSHRIRSKRVFDSRRFDCYLGGF